jgi:signal transduction histidine kinase
MRIMRRSRSGSRPSWPLRWHLSLLIGGTLLPVVVFSGLLVLQLTGEMQRAAERRLQRSAHAMNSSFEREARATIQALLALAESEALDQGDLAGFRAEARRVQRTQPSWLTVLLLTPDGQQLLNLSRPPGAPLSRATEPESLRQTVELQRPTVGTIALSSVTQQWAFPIRVPVIRDGQLRYVLTAVIPPRPLADLVLHQQPEEDGEFTRVLVDHHGVIVFRTRDPERFIGKPASRHFLEETRAATGGVFRSVTLEGTPSYVAFSRSALSNWTSAVVVPSEVIDGPFRRSLLAVVASGMLAILVSAAGALYFSRRFARSIRSVAAAAESLSHGGQPQVEPLGITEMERVGRSLGASAERLRLHAEEEQRVRTELEQAVRHRDEFLSLASHELKTPLTSLGLQTQMLQRRLEQGEVPAPDSMRKLLDQTARQTRRLARLVDDMLDISRIAAGRLALERETFDLAALAAEVLTKLGPQLSAAGCVASLQVEEPVIGTWDRYRLEQVLTNLLTNAARYAAGTPVEVSVRRHEHQAQLRVRDDGRGIAPGDQERIFRKFERAVDGREVSGLGLGLFIVREIVQMHGGSVHVESAPGQGATFTVTLPFLEAASAPSRVETTA